MLSLRGAHLLGDRLFITLPLLTPLLHVAGLGYHHPSAEDAWRRILVFFAEHLG